MERMKVLIVEDEPIVARYVKHILESMQGFEVVGICENGEDAIECCKREVPGLLITDIKMPGITGLELIREMKKQGVEQKTIIISGFKNFDYAKEAISLGVEDYITKPINLEEMKKTLLKIREDYQREAFLRTGGRMERAMGNLDEAFFKENFPYKRFRLLAVYQSGEMDDLEYMVDWKENLISFCYRNALFVLEGKEEVKDLEKAAEEKAAGKESSLHAMGQQEDGLRRMIRNITLSRKRKHTCAVLLIEKMEVQSDSFRQFQKLYQCLREFVIPGRLVKKEYETPKQIQQRTEFADAALLKKLELHITAKEWKAVSGQLRELFVFWEKNRYSLYRIKTGIHLITDKLQKAGVFAEGKVFVNEYVDDCIRYSDSYEEMRETILSYLEEAFKAHHSEQKEGKSSRQLYENICHFVYQHEDKNFSLNEISNIFGMSQPFVRKVFRTHVGMSYNEWVVKLKIERAKELMRTNPNLMVKEVAEKIGYEQLYFSTVFNKYVGISPSEYKFQIAEEKES